MKLSDEFEDQESKNRLPVIYMAIGIVAFASLVFVVVLCMNYKEKPHKSVTITDILTVQDEINAQKSDRDPILDELGVGESTLTSDQLDFWNMYKDDKTETNDAISDGMTKEERIEKNAEELLKQEEEAKQQEQEEDLSENGTKTLVVRPDGSEQWIMINAYIPKNDYKKEGFVYEEPIMKYFDQGDKKSSVGVILNEEAGNVDFSKLKKEGIEYVIVRIGYRGYESGTIYYDERFDEYERGAEQAGLRVGAYFESQAITVEEAEEEAQAVIGNLMERSITYPVALQFGVVSNDKARTDDLTKSQITEITNHFCQMVEDSGFQAMVYGSKFWLLRRLDLTQMGDYDICLMQEGETPDYPYGFDLWQYDNSAKLDGVEQEVPLSISFIDYSKK